MTHLIVPAWRSFARNLTRYRILLVALVLIGAALTMVTGAILGLQSGVRAKAARYFAGDLVVLGLAGDGRSLIDDPQALFGALERVEAEVEVRAVSARSTHYATNQIELFFAGYDTQQRRLVGVEWDRERIPLSEMQLVAGALPEGEDESAALISTAAARALGITAGDELLVSIISDRGRSNTAAVIVAGIYAESSFFGYTTYIHRRELNRLREVGEDNVNEIGVYLANAERDEAAAAVLVTEALAEAGLATFPVLATRSEYNVAPGQPREQREYGVVTIGAQLDEITDLIEAITLIAAAVMALFLVIVAVGVSNTWTMVVWERTRELGTLRALGLGRAGTVAMVLLEALYLALAGGMLGVAAGTAVLAAVGRWVTFAPNAATTLFLTQGRLAWRLPLWAPAAVVGLALVASLVGAARAAIRAARIHPVEAMRRGGG